MSTPARMSIAGYLRPLRGLLQPLPVVIAVFYGLALTAPLACLIAAPIGLAVRLAAREGVERPAITRQVRAFGLATVVFVLAAVISLLANPIGEDALAMLLRIAPAPLVVGALLLVAPFDPTRAIWLGTTAGATIAGLEAIYQVGVTDLVRAHVGTHAILFGNLSLLLGFISLVCSQAVVHRTRLVTSFSLAAFALGLIASVLSGSRGSWVAIPALLGLLALQYHRRVRPLQLIGVTVLVVASLTVASLISEGRATQRVSAAVEQVESYATSAPGDESRTNSVGLRFEMWRAALDAFKEQPWLGVGRGNLQERFQQQANTGARDPLIAEFRHAHNQYLTSLANGGALGLLAWLLLLLVPGWYCARAFHASDERHASLATAGLITVVGYALFGLTDAIFESLLPVTFYAITIGLITHQLGRHERAFDKTANNDGRERARTSSSGT